MYEVVACVHEIQISEQRGGSCEHGYELSGSLKGCKFLDYLSNYSNVKDFFMYIYDVLRLSKFKNLIFQDK